jgi:large subunit ribosomal protein L22
MHYKASHRYADVTARKLRPVADLIRGKAADEAREMLRFLPNRSARLVEQVLKSALGNAEDRGARDIEDLVVSESRVDGGPMMKRHRPRARGTAFPIKKRYAHIRIAVWDGDDEVNGEQQD